MRTQSKKQQQQQQLEQQHQILSSELFKNSKTHKNHFEILTFLKSNYKYKRRCRRCSVTAHPVQAAEMQVKQCFGGKGIASTFEGNTCCHHHYHHNNNNNNNITQDINTKSDKSSFNLINFSFVVFSIVANIIYRKLLLPLHRKIGSSARSAKSQQQQQIAAVTLDGVAAAPCLDCAAVYNNDVNNDNDDNDDADDSDETRCQQNYDKLSTLGCQSRPPRRHNVTLRQRRATWASMQQQPQHRRGSATASNAPPLLPLEIDSHIHVMPIFMTLFIALALSVRCAEGGACWQKTLSNGKCNEIFSLNITKTECCSTNQEFSYTERELSSVEYFFATAIGGGMECAPCLESCKNVVCGPNKKCAKRKGRPKCICAPECGAATRKRKKAKLFRGSQHQQQQQHHSDISLRPIQRNLDAAVIFGKSARDIRSLSSEINSQNIGLDDEVERRRRVAMGTTNSWPMTGTSDAVPNRHSSSQRKLIVMQSQARAQNSKREQKEHNRLLIAEQPPVEADAEKTTTRRLQVISNVNNNHHNHHNRNNPNGRKRNRSEKERLHKQERHQKTTTKESTIQSTSRHKPNGKNKNNNNSSNDNSNNNNNNLQQTKNFDVNNAKLRRIQQNPRQLEDGPNRDQQQQHRQQQQQQQQHHGRHHQFRKRKKKLHNQLKDQNAVTATEIDHEQLAGATTVTMSGSNIKATKTKSTTTATSTTPANSSSSSSSSLSLAITTEQQRLFKHGSTLATSSSSATSLPTLTMAATSASSSSLSSSWLPSDKANNRHSQSRINSNSRVFFNSDDLTFDDRIYDKFNLHGFPNPEHKYTQLDRTHSSHHHHQQHPVCGTDGRTYNTKCQLKKRACRTDNAELTVAYQGHCKTTCNGVKCLNGLTCVEDHYTIPHCIACRTDCPLDDLDDFGVAAAAAASAGAAEIQAQRAVCGVDGKTYRSVCDINRMICKIGRSIGVAYPGPCRDDRVTCSDINCGSKRTCLVDLLTHEPRCVSCRYKCSRKRRPASVRYEEGKICGANNRTYHSWCEMRKDSCATGFYIDVKKLGVCQ